MQTLKLIDREDIHLALLDMMMPGMDGITARNRLRERHNLPVILLTAKSEDTDKMLGPTVGAVTIDDDAKRVAFVADAG